MAPTDLIDEAITKLIVIEAMDPPPAHEMGGRSLDEMIFWDDPKSPGRCAGAFTQRAQVKLLRPSTRRGCHPPVLVNLDSVWSLDRGSISLVNE